jgi:hypothetical protein
MANGFIDACDKPDEPAPYDEIETLLDGRADQLSIVVVYVNGEEVVMIPSEPEVVIGTILDIVLVATPTGVS